MCRLLAWDSRAPITADDLLGPDAGSLESLRQVHCDGWGMAYLDELQNIHEERGTAPAHSSAEFANLARTRAVPAALMHLRWASEGIPVHMDNTHPFSAYGPHGPLTFIHNGYVERTEDLRELIDPEFRERLVGDTDSEQYFYVLMTYMRQCGGDLIEAFQRTVDVLADHHYTSLNAFVLTPKELVAICQHRPEFRDDDVEEDYFHLTWAQERETFSIWSTGIRPSADQSKDLENGSLLHIDRVHGTATVHALK